MPRKTIHTIVSHILLSLAGFLASYSVTAKLPVLPEAVANNATAKVTVNDETYLLTFMGLGSEKTYKDVHNKTWALRVGDDAWHEIAPVPSSLTLRGRLASVAVGIDELTYIFSGYMVATWWLHGGERPYRNLQP